MSKTYEADGKTLNLTAPSGGTTVGVGYVIGQIFAVAETAAAAGDPFQGTRVGVHRLAKKAGDTPAQGGLAYWHNTNKELTTLSTGATLVGAFVEPALSGDATAVVLLNQT